MNVDIFDKADYKLSYTVYKGLVGESYYYEFTCTVLNMKIQSRKCYTTKEGALKAGEKWLKKYIHKEFQMLDLSDVELACATLVLCVVLYRTL